MMILPDSGAFQPKKSNVPFSKRLHSDLNPRNWANA
jgi:hypothetical protein